MKKVLFIIISFCLALSMQAQTIHWLTFIDTNDANVGEMDKNSQALLFNRFRNVVNAALASYGYTADNQEYFGDRLTPQNCTKAVNSLTISNHNDIIVFYYIGHGTHAAQEKNKFPQMLMGRDWDKEREFIPLKWVGDQLKSKGARLSITIGMCCNPIQIASAKDKPNFSSSSFAYNTGNTYLSDKEIDHILSLFLESTGSIIQASASVGELSWGYDFKDMRRIDTFSRFLILQFDDLIKNGSTLTWSSFLSAIGNNVSALQREVVSMDPSIQADAQRNGYSPYQTPFNEMNISRASRPIISKETPEPTKPTPKDDEMTIEDLMEQCLSYMANSNNPQEKRIEMAQQVKTMFSSTASVKILSQDGDVVVNSRKAANYFDIISTSRILLNVNYVDMDFDSKGLIKVLKVKETYRRKGY